MTNRRRSEPLGTKLQQGDTEVQYPSVQATPSDKETLKMMIFLRTRRSMSDFTVRTVCKTRSECEYMYVVCDYLWSYEIRNT